MSNKVPIFEIQATDAVSEAFKLSVPDSIGVADTSHSSYIEIFGGLGGGVLTLEKKCGDGVFRNSEQESIIIADKFPSLATDVLTLPINYKDREEEFQMRLTGATGATLSAYGINMNQD